MKEKERLLKSQETDEYQSEERKKEKKKNRNKVYIHEKVKTNKQIKGLTNKSKEKGTSMISNCHHHLGLIVLWWCPVQNVTLV